MGFSATKTPEAPPSSRPTTALQFSWHCYIPGRPRPPFALVTTRYAGLLSGIPQHWVCNLGTYVRTYATLYFAYCIYIVYTTEYPSRSLQVCEGGVVEAEAGVTRRSMWKP